MKIARSKLKRLVRSEATPMAMSLDMLRKFGYFAEPVEQNNIRLPGIKHAIKRDLLGFADIIALKEHVLLVQTTTHENMGARIRKIQRCESFEACKRAGVLVHVHGWGLGGLKVVDMTMRAADGAWTYATLFDDIVRAGVKSKLKPRVQQHLPL